MRPFDNNMPRPLRGKTSRLTVQAARDLRHQATSAEDILWQALRSGRLAGLKFRRQHPFDSFILDFFCVRALLAVELDGAVHLKPEQAQHDALRDEYLQSKGIRVIHIKNEEVEKDLRGVLERILAEVGRDFQAKV